MCNKCVTGIFNSVLCDAGIPSEYPPHFKTYIWLETFRYNSTQGQLKNGGGGELHEIKWSQDKMEIDK